jgi:hypothetical protein
VNQNQIPTQTYPAPQQSAAMRPAPQTAPSFQPQFPLTTIAAPVFGAAKSLSSQVQEQARKSAGGLFGVGITIFVIGVVSALILIFLFSAEAVQFGSSFLNPNARVLGMPSVWFDGLEVIAGLIIPILMLIVALKASGAQKAYIQVAGVTASNPKLFKNACAWFSAMRVIAIICAVVCGILILIFLAMTLVSSWILSVLGLVTLFIAAILVVFLIFYIYIAIWTSRLLRIYKGREL